MYKACMAVTLMAFGCGGEPSVGPESAAVSCYLTVSSSEDGFDDDSDLSFGGKAIGGAVWIYINGDPVLRHTFGGSMDPIDKWIGDGANEISLQGTTDTPLYLKVSLVSPRDWKVRKLLAKQKVMPLAEGRSSVFSFQLNLGRQLPRRDELPVDEPGRARCRVEVEALLSQLRDAMRRHDGPAAASLGWSGCKMWWPVAHPTQKGQLKTLIAEATARFDDPTVTLDKEEPKYRFVFGKRCVLVWSGESPETRWIYGFIYRRGEKECRMPAFCVVRVSGQWVIWN